MTSNIYTFKTTCGDTLLGDLHSVDEKNSLLQIILPVKMILVPTPTPAGIITQYLPTLYQPFGITNIIPFKTTFFTSIIPCADFDERYYFKVLDMLLEAETHRLLASDSFFNEQDYPDTIIMRTPETIQ